MYFNSIGLSSAYSLFFNFSKISFKNLILLLRVRWIPFPGGEDISAKHIQFLFIREREHFNSRGVELVVGDVDEPGAEETGPANS